MLLSMIAVIGRLLKQFEKVKTSITLLKKERKKIAMDRAEKGISTGV